MHHMRSKHLIELQKLHDGVATTLHPPKGDSKPANVGQDTSYALPPQDTGSSEPYRSENIEQGAAARTDTGAREIERLKARESLLMASDAALRAKIQRMEEEAYGQREANLILSSERLKLVKQVTELGQND
jgi:hypothetical protein